MRTVNVHQAKTHLSALLQEVEQGAEIVIARAGRPVARLVGVNVPAGRRVLGRDAGSFRVPEDFDDPLPDELLEVFGR